MTAEPTEGIFKLNSLNKCIATRNMSEISFFGSQCKMSVIGCEESNVYIDCNVETLLVSSCVNCTIFVAAVNKVCTIEKCEKVTVCVAANIIRIGNCIDSLVHSYTPMFSPIVYGDTRSLRMAPHNANYGHFVDHLRRANIKFELPQGKETPSDWFTEQINSFRSPM